MAKGVMIVAEQRDGDIRKISYELVSEGRRLADSLGQELTAILLGHNIKDKASELGNYGADKVLVANDPLLEKYTTDAYVSVIADLVQANDELLESPERAASGYFHPEIAGTLPRQTLLIERIVEKR